MAEKMLDDRAKAVRTLLSALEQHEGLLDEGLARFFAPVLEEGEELPSVAVWIDLVKRAVTHYEGRMNRTHKDWFGARAARRRVYRKLETARRSIYRLLTRLRGWLQTELTVKRADTWMGVKGETPRDTPRLLAVARTLHSNIVDPKPEDLDGRLETGRLDADLAERIEDLDNLDLEHTVARRSSDTAQIAWRDAFEAHNEAFHNAALWTVALYSLAGQPKLSEAVMPSGRRLGLLRSQVKKRTRSKT